MDLRERLQAHMRSELATTPVSDLGGVMERGETIRRRRRAVMTAAPAVAVVLGVVGVMASGLWSDAARERRYRPGRRGEAALSRHGRPRLAGGARYPGWAEDTIEARTRCTLSTVPGASGRTSPTAISRRPCMFRRTARTGTTLSGLASLRPAASGDLLYLVGTGPVPEQAPRRSGRVRAAALRQTRTVVCSAGAQLWPDLIVADGVCRFGYQPPDS